MNTFREVLDSYVKLDVYKAVATILWKDVVAIEGNLEVHNYCFIYL